MGRINWKILRGDAFVGNIAAFIRILLKAEEESRDQKGISDDR